jgi:hypothetical protein
LWLFKIWLRTVPSARRSEILHDERVRFYMPEQQWRLLVREVRKTYDDFVKPIDAFFLDSLYFADQRFRMFSPIALTGFIPGLDTFASKKEQATNESLKTLDSINVNVLQAYLKANPFPKIAEVGRRQARAVGIILQHQFDTAIFDTYLPILETRCREGEAEWETYALMFDRNEIYSGRPQRYGTQYQFIGETRQRKLAPLVDDLESVNRRRKKLGLIPIHEY